MSDLWPGERLVSASGSQLLVYARITGPDAPFVLFLPGGGHLARIAYGDPQARREDFLDRQLEKRGVSLVAISYPSDHPVFAAPDPTLTVADWADAVAEIMRLIVDENKIGSPILTAAWSMAGKIAIRLSQALCRHELPERGLVSLSARPPWPGFSPRAEGGEALTEAGFWDYGEERAADLFSMIDEVNRFEGRVIISAEDHRRFYRGNGPIMLRGTEDRLRDGQRVFDEAAALADLDGFAFAEAPLTATISPTWPSDGEMAMVAPSHWSTIAIMAIVRRELRGVALEAMSVEDWTWLRTLALEWPLRMNRFVDGGHFFFLGERGAAETARHLVDLDEALGQLSRDLSDLRTRIPR